MLFRSLIFSALLASSTFAFQSLNPSPSEINPGGDVETRALPMTNARRFALGLPPARPRFARHHPGHDDNGPSPAQGKKFVVELNIERIYQFLGLILPLISLASYRSTPPPPIPSPSS